MQLKRQAVEKIKIGIDKNPERSENELKTWNVKSLTNKEKKLRREILKLKLDYIGLTETKRKGNGITMVANESWIFWSEVNKSKNTKYYKRKFS